MLSKEVDNKIAIKINGNKVGIYLIASTTKSKEVNKK